MFWVGVLLQGVANLSLGFGGLLLAFYSLPDDEQHTMRKEIIKRLGWALIVLVVFFAPFFVYYNYKFFSTYRIDFENLSTEQDFAAMECVSELNIIWRIISATNDEEANNMDGIIS